ncbi:MAG: flagellar basal body P-ring formation protein FlgA [Acidobacteria bacterium]|nr:flagellar basal body P-ring formation protein FlgA [Acidobacteriota bacterium]MCB9397410.1 flagellar basal body P-ring formation protein FlgA [Acidobacteriota bacterium]
MFLFILLLATDTQWHPVNAKSPQESVEKTFKSIVQSQLQERYAEYEVAQWVCPNIHTHHLPTAIRIVPRDADLWLGRLFFDLQLRDSQGGIQHLVAQAQVRVLSEVPVALESLERGMPLSSARVEWQKQWLDRAYDPPVDRQEWDQYQVRTAIRSGTTITQRFVEKTPLVERNQPVQVMASAEQIRISLRAIALDKGAMDDIIRVKNPLSGGILRVRVSGPGEAQIQ